MRVLVTGGAGFIGSAFVRLLCSKGYYPIVIDKLTYAGDIKRLASVFSKFKLYRCDIRDARTIECIFRNNVPDVVVNISAESHVDKSIENSTPFLETNVRGTKVLMDTCRKFKVKRFIHISTDEVYGENRGKPFVETDQLYPNNPYSASKASADMFIRSYIRTYKFPAIIIRPCNNYGEYQHREKFIAKCIWRFRHNEKMSVYGDNGDMREWIYVGDCAEGIYTVMRKGKPGEIYNLGTGNEIKNTDVIYKILRLMGKDDKFICYEKPRPGGDRSYLISSRKIRKLGWKPRVSFREGLLRAIGNT